MWKREGESRNKRSDTNATCFVLYLKLLVFAFFSNGLYMFLGCDKNSFTSIPRKRCIGIGGHSRSSSSGGQAGFVRSRLLGFKDTQTEQVREWEACSCWNCTSLVSSHLQQQMKRDTLLPEDTGSAFYMSCVPLRGGDLVMNYEAP